ncbi:MAG: serine/threonine protein kinase [Deltaproteobacteria bacterium]|nr:serine/threonine protein kinase [Deltaproteobacteria bacterium]
MKMSRIITPNHEIESGAIEQRYKLLSKIGEGGMGDVFLAFQRGAVDFGRFVVVKRTHEKRVQQSSSSIKMFMNEARLAASLNHPHIVQVYDFCVTEDAISIVMEYVEGETLKYVLSNCNKQKVRIPFGISSRLILDACDAIHYAHTSTSATGNESTIIHRDIGLHNLMLNSNGYLKVIDFGIARSSIQSDFTSPGMIKGTPGYMAPELFTRSEHDHRIDVYAMGLCLYELATQKRAFKFAKNVNLGKIVQEITTRELPPPSELQSDLPKGLDDVVFKAIAKDRDKRYQTIDDFANDLHEVCAVETMSGGDIKKWFTSQFEERLNERRAFGARMMASIHDSDDTRKVGLQHIVEEEKALFNGTSTTRTAQSVLSTSSEGTQVSQVVIGQALVYKIIAAMFLFIAVVAGILYWVTVKDTPSPTTTAELALGDNVLVSSNPPGAVLTIDNDEMGVINAEGLAFHVAPNKEHHLVISKKGYRNFSIQFIGPADGTKMIAATLVKTESQTSNSNSEFEMETEDGSIKKNRPAVSFKKRFHRPLPKKTMSSSAASHDSNDLSANSAPADSSPQGAPVEKNASGSITTDSRSIPDGNRRIPLPDEIGTEKKRVPVVDE